jgi:hypothetical protein
LWVSVRVYPFVRNYQQIVIKLCLGEGKGIPYFNSKKKKQQVGVK